MKSKKELVLIGKLERDYEGNIGIREKDRWVEGLAEIILKKDFDKYLNNKKIEEK